MGLMLSRSGSQCLHAHTHVDGQKHEQHSNKNAKSCCSSDQCMQAARGAASAADLPEPLLTILTASAPIHKNHTEMINILQKQ